MSYEVISVKDAVNRINNNVNGWFLPAVQRPYVWGSRYESEQYICRLFDSILRGYPIGTLLLWNTGEEIAYREFMRDYTDGDIPTLVDKGKFGKEDKWLIYDGQQRMQTLYSCLNYTFNKKVLVYDLLFDDKSRDDANETAFSFMDSTMKLPLHKLRMIELFQKNSKDKTSFRRELLQKIDLSNNEADIVEQHLDELWKVFVDTDKASLAFFPIKSQDESEVNEIFERLNSGGMALSQADLLFSKIKGYKRSDVNNYDFEEKLQFSSKKIYSATGNGYTFGAYNILQLLNLLIKDRVRVDPKKVTEYDLELFPVVWESLERPLIDFFTKYIFGQFKINNASIIPRKISLLPIIVYFYELYNKKIIFEKIEKSNLLKINKYFIKSQINDWSLQSYVDSFTKIIKELSKVNSGMFEFPLDEIENKIKEKSKREVNITPERFEGYTWFSLKILTPNKIYHFEPDMQERFNPEIDHVFPKKLQGQDEEYRQKVDVLWNLQPIVGGINQMKLNHHPYDFFRDRLTNNNGTVLAGSKYYDQFDFLPDLIDNEWKNYENFIQNRKNRMIQFIENKYNIKMIRDADD